MWDFEPFWIPVLITVFSKPFWKPGESVSTFFDTGKNDKKENES
jgi:hypothetical protein